MLDTPALRRLEASDVVLGDGVGRITDAAWRRRVAWVPSIGGRQEGRGGRRSRIERGAVPAGGAARPAADNNAAGSSTVTCYAVICTGLPRGPCNPFQDHVAHWRQLFGDITQSVLANALTCALPIAVQPVGPDRCQ